MVSKIASVYSGNDKMMFHIKILQRIQYLNVSRKATRHLDSTSIMKHGTRLLISSVCLAGQI